ncbi:hypothetical protein BGZ76_002739 [Entomortierella beljakovae]|nr:hypothetical protein BGZ76_002739 [Entomortierella beljakovae]
MWQYSTNNILMNGSCNNKGTRVIIKALNIEIIVAVIVIIAGGNMINRCWLRMIPELSLR